MPTTFHLSPLLKARPSILGVAGNGDNFSVFKELLHISDLSAYFEHRKSPTNSVSEIDESNDDPSSSRTTDNSSNLHKNETNPGVRAKSCTSPSEHGIVHQIVNRTPEGATPMPYQFQPKTLELFQLLKKLKIPYETEIYKPKDERLFVDSKIYYCKNLFLKDRKGQFFLVICHEDINMDLKHLRKSLNAYRNFNFATADDMASLLSTSPGGVTPFGLMNPASANVQMVVHKSLASEDAWLMFHPFDNDLATKITLPNLMRFLKSCNHDVTFVK